jgi:hypothetical protein
MLIIVVLVSVLLLLGVTFVLSGTTNKNIDTFKKDSITLINASKNVYGNLEKTNSEYITTSEEGISTAVCITLDGLKENDYLKNEYKDWEGYLVIEKDLDNNFNFIAWLTNGKYIIDGYTLDNISKLSLKDETLLKGDSIDLPHKSFTGTESDKGGLDKLTNYNQNCINEKIE